MIEAWRLMDRHSAIQATLVDRDFWGSICSLFSIESIGKRTVSFLTASSLLCSLLVLSIASLTNSVGRLSDAFPNA